MLKITDRTCSLCGAVGVNKTTCPLNPKAINPRAHLHNATKVKDAVSKSTDLVPESALLRLPVEMKLAILENKSDDRASPRFAVP